MLKYPSIDPVAIQLGPVAIHWYGLMYLFGFACAWALAHYQAKHRYPDWQNNHIADLIFYCALGVILGGRIGYMLFYQFSAWLAAPLSLFKIWQGGMSFHGGLLGVIFAMMYFAYRSKRSLLVVSDFVAPLVPLGLAFGRLGNFINGELWGRESQLPWAMVFPQAGPMPRHPSQLYEMLLEGILLFVILWWYGRKPRPVFAMSALFLLLYGIFRFGVEWCREPDQHLGFLAWDWLTMGQILSLPLILIGAFCLYRGQSGFPGIKRNPSS